MKAVLVPLDGSPPLPLNKDMILVGRKETCDIVINHKTISKLHCVLVKADGMLLLRDLASTNGCRVNGQRIRRSALLSQDELALADFHYRVEIGTEQDDLSGSNVTDIIDIARDFMSIPNESPDSGGKGPKSDTALSVYDL